MLDLKAWRVWCASGLAIAATMFAGHGAIGIPVANNLTAARQSTGTVGFEITVPLRRR